MIICSSSSKHNPGEKGFIYRDKNGEILKIPQPMVYIKEVTVENYIQHLIDINSTYNLNEINRNKYFYLISTD